MSEITSKIKTSVEKANNVLVTVGKNPTADELTAALALTLAIDKMGKHASAIFSGKIPHFMSFLHPEKVFEDSTDSFRDFVISLDKDKADRLRYKVEGDLVKIFITPYHTSLSAEDLSFDHGELNIDMVIALGVKRREDLDEAILLSQDKILHSATVLAIDLGAPAKFANLNWSNIDASGYSEALSKLIANLGEDLISERIATTLLTGIVLATNQFSNEKTRPSTMQAASELLAKGADQQLIVAEMRQNSNEIDEPIEIAQDLPDEVNLHQTPSREAVMPEEREVKPARVQARQTEEIPQEETQIPLENDDFESGVELDHSSPSGLEAYMPPELPDFSASEELSPLPDIVPTSAETILPQQQIQQTTQATQKKSASKRHKVKDLAKKTQIFTKNMRKNSNQSQQVQPKAPTPPEQTDQDDPGRFVIPV